MYHQLQPVKCVVVKVVSKGRYEVKVSNPVSDKKDDGLLICSEPLAVGEELTGIVGDERIPLVLFISPDERLRLQSRNDP